MKLDELMERAVKGYEHGYAIESQLGYDGSKASTYVVQIKNSDLSRLINLCKLQHEAFEALYAGTKLSEWDSKAVELFYTALSEYEEFNK